MENKSIKPMHIIFVIFLTIGIFLVIWLVYFNSFPYGDDYVAWIEYQAVYDGTMNLHDIEVELAQNHIIFSHDFYADWSGSHNITTCNYGPHFNEVNVSDSQCIIYDWVPENSYYSHVNVRIYGADIRNGKLDSFKPAYEESMDYITGIIRDATGKSPVQFVYYYEDGAPLDLPSSI